jgi:hypothetical protein
MVKSYTTPYQTRWMIIPFRNSLKKPEKNIKIVNGNHAGISYTNHLAFYTGYTSRQYFLDGYA